MSRTITIPDLLTSSYFLEVDTNDQHYRINDSRFSCDYHNALILQGEITRTRILNPTVDFDKIGSLIFSPDSESAELGYEMLSQYSQLATKILRNRRNGTTSMSTIYDFVYLQTKL